MAVFGLPPVDLNGLLLGIMDPLCSGTRAATYTAQGQWAPAWRYNPLDILVGLAAAIAVLHTVVGVLPHRWVTVTVAWTPRRVRAVTIFVIVLLVALTTRRQPRAELLIAGT